LVPSVFTRIRHHQPVADQGEGELRAAPGAPEVVGHAGIPALGEALLRLLEGGAGQLAGGQLGLEDELDVFDAVEGDARLVAGQGDEARQGQLEPGQLLERAQVLAEAQDQAVLAHRLVGRAALPALAQRRAGPHLEGTAQVRGLEVDDRAARHGAGDRGGPRGVGATAGGGEERAAEAREGRRAQEERQSP